MKTPKISVVIPFYNGEKYANRIISAFCAQTFDDFEVIAVNDGSTDNTSAVLHELKKSSPINLKIMETENGGVSRARNFGISCATGEYVCLCDCDDIVSKDYLKILYTAIKRSNCNVALAFSSRKEPLYEGDLLGYEVVEKVAALKKYFYNSNKYHHCAAIYKREIFSKDLRYKEGNKYSEDVHLLIRILSTVPKVAFVNHPIYCYVVNDNSIMTSKLTEERLSAIELMRDLEPIVKQNAPEFSREFEKYAASKHCWSILWQAAASFDSYSEFCSYAQLLDAKNQLKKLVGYPAVSVKLTAALYLISSRLYYHLIRFYVKNLKK